MLDRIRAAWHALRGYAAAADLRASTWAPSSGSANAEVAGAAATVARPLTQDRDALASQLQGPLPSCCGTSPSRRGDLAELAEGAC
jgi:hypothetical protein